MSTSDFSLENVRLHDDLVLGTGPKESHAIDHIRRLCARIDPIEGANTICGNSDLARKGRKFFPIKTFLLVPNVSLAKFCHKKVVPWNHSYVKYTLAKTSLLATLYLEQISLFNRAHTLRQNGLLPRKKLMEISNIDQETTCPQGLRTGFG